MDYSGRDLLGKMEVRKVWTKITKYVDRTNKIVGKVESMFLNLESEIEKHLKTKVLKQGKYRTLKQSVLDAVNSEIKKTKDMKGRGTDITKEKVPRQQKQSPTPMDDSNIKRVFERLCQEIDWLYGIIKGRASGPRLDTGTFIPLDPSDHLLHTEALQKIIDIIETFTKLDNVNNTPSSPAQSETDNHNRQPHNKLVHLKDGKQEKEASKRLEELEQENAILHKKVKTLNQDWQSLAEDRDALKTRLDKVNITPSSPAQWENDNYNRQPHNKLVHLKGGKQEKEAAKRLEELEQENAILHKKVKTLNQDLQSLAEDKDALMTRMSKMAGDKLTHNNPAITDLSDPNRPQKLAEKYGELYDNEWTDAIDKLITRKEEKHDRACIDILSGILKFCYSECERIADSQLSQLVMDCVNLKIPTKQQVKPPEGSEAIKRFLLDAQHSSSMFTIRAAIDSVKASLTRAKELKAKQIPLYTEKCIKICWSMVTHNPRLFLLWPDVSKDKQIRFDMFQAYTRSGDTVEYVVWPALLLYQDGPLLRKGTVQPEARQREADKSADI